MKIRARVEEDEQVEAVEAEARVVAFQVSHAERGESSERHAGVAD